MNDGLRTQLVAVTTLKREQLSKRTQNNDQKRLFAQILGALTRLQNESKPNIPVPKAYVVGLEDAGKSSVIDALCGFSFNKVVSGMGTRSILIIELENKPEQKEPLIQIKEENATWTTLTLGKVKDAIIQREEELLMKEYPNRKEGDRDVASESISLKIKHCNCANLVICDTPGFRQNDVIYGPKIEAMVKDCLLKERESIIVYVQTSGEAFINSALSDDKSFIRTIDPKLERTFVIMSKFDLRLKMMGQQQNRKSIQDLLTVKDRGNTPAFKPHWVSLPTHELNADYAEKLDEAYISSIVELVKKGSDIEDIRETKQYTVGVYPCISELEDEMLQKTKTMLAQSSSILQDEKKKTVNAISTVEKEYLDQTQSLENVDVRAHELLIGIVKAFERALQGTTILHKNYGKTLNEEFEIIKCTEDQKGSFLSQAIESRIPSVSQKLAGGAALRRVETWLLSYIAERKFGEITDDDLINLLGQQPTTDAISWENQVVATLMLEKSKKRFKKAIDFFGELVLSIAKRTLNACVESDSDLEHEPMARFFLPFIENILASFVSKMVSKFHWEFEKYSISSFSSVEHKLPNFDDLESYIIKGGESQEFADSLFSMAYGDDKKYRLQTLLENVRLKNLDDAAKGMLRRIAFVLFMVTKTKFAQEFPAIYYQLFRSVISKKLTTIAVKGFSKGPEKDLLKKAIIADKTPEIKLNKLQKELKGLEEIETLLINLQGIDINNNINDIIEVPSGTANQTTLVQSGTQVATSQTNAQNGSHAIAASQADTHSGSQVTAVSQKNTHNGSKP